MPTDDRTPEERAMDSAWGRLEAPETTAARLEAEKTGSCGFRFYYRVYDEMEWDTCGEPAIACDLDDGDRPGRCGKHLPNFDYMEAHGFIPKPHEVIVLMDRPSYSWRVN